VFISSYYNVINGNLHEIGCQILIIDLSDILVTNQGATPCFYFRSTSKYPPAKPVALDYLITTNPQQAEVDAPGLGQFVTSSK